MTFQTIMNKNLRHNIRKYASYFLVNAFVVCVLFLFSSLLFNDVLNADAGVRSAGSLIMLAAVGIVIFSLIFLRYTGVYFVRSRGREFGVYLTLGMTTRDLRRMINAENVKIFAGAAVIGLAAALLLGKLFYLALAKVLGMTENLFFLSWKTFALSLGVLIAIFIAQTIASSRFIRKLSIVEITKSERTKGVANQNALAGIIAVVVFVASLIFLHGIIGGADWAKPIARASMELSLCVPMGTLLLSLFFIIGSGLAGASAIFKKFPALYQRNILLLSGLSHRFRAYRASLYSVTLLVAFAVFFIGIGMSLYTYGEMTIDTFQPFGAMVEQRGNLNDVSDGELREILPNGGEIRRLPYSDGQVYREMNNRDELFLNFRQASFIVRESDFNKWLGLNISVEPHELLIVTNQQEAVEEGVTYDTTLVVEPYAEGVARADAFREASLSKPAFLQTINGAMVLEFAQQDTSIVFMPFVNSHGSLEFIRSHANVVDDAVFESIRGGQDNSLIAIDAPGGENVTERLIAGLRAKNNLPSTAWLDASESDFLDKDSYEGLRPIVKAERHGILLKANGFLLFAMAFLGLLFLLSSCIVLYYKLASDTDDETANVGTLRRIGATAPECRRWLGAHLAALFFLPLALGGALGLYLTYQFLSNSSYAAYLTGQVAIMYGIVALAGTALYATLRRRFFRAVKV
jgi:hypothetical protein